MATSWCGCGPSKSGRLAGPISRFDDEGITFESDGGLTFDVRDLVSEVQRGDGFDVVVIGTTGRTPSTKVAGQTHFAKAGRGDDRVTGGRRNDLLVGGGENNSLSGKWVATRSSGAATT
jgi:hypothetical protein